jgi:hypothetical protein
MFQRCGFLIRTLSLTAYSFSNSFSKSVLKLPAIDSLLRIRSRHSIATASVHWKELAARMPNAPAASSDRNRRATNATRTANRALKIRWPTGRGFSQLRCVMATYERTRAQPVGRRGTQ